MPPIVAATPLPPRGVYRALTLQDPTAQQQLWQNRVGNADPREPLWITLGTVAIPAANVAELELRLPADW